MLFAQNYLNVLGTMPQLITREFLEHAMSHQQAITYTMHMCNRHAFFATSNTQFLRQLLRPNMATGHISPTAEFTYQLPSQLSICSSIVMARKFGKFVRDYCQDNVNQCDR